MLKVMCSPIIKDMAMPQAAIPSTVEDNYIPSRYLIYPISRAFLDTIICATIKWLLVAWA